MSPEDKTAAVAVVTNDHDGNYFITLGVGDGTCERWKVKESLARKLRRELNDRFD
jgi:hypothetical protein